MNVLIIVSFLLAAVVMGFTILTSTDNPEAFIDVHGLTIVIGGSLACAAIAYQLDRIWLMIKVFLSRMVKGRRPNYRETIASLLKLSSDYSDSPEKARNSLKDLKDPFLVECMELFLDELGSPEELRKLLKIRVKTIYERYSEDAKMFQGLGKYPPAMGLMGAVIGMIALLRSLGAEGAENNIGPAMSVALVATFYGIAVANLLVIPIGDNLMESAKQMKTKNSIIVEGILLIQARTNQVMLAEELNSHLLPSERLDWKSIV